MPAIVGGIVGLAGIGVTLVSTRIAAQSGVERARRDEKLRIYAAFISAVTNAFHAAGVHLTQAGEKRKGFRTTQIEATRLSLEAVNALSAVRLIGPREVGTLGAEAIMALTGLLNSGSGSHVEAMRKLANVTLAMRMDLGRHGPPGLSSLKDLLIHLAHLQTDSRAGAAGLINRAARYQQPDPGWRLHITGSAGRSAVHRPAAYPQPALPRLPRAATPSAAPGQEAARMPDGPQPSGHPAMAAIPPMPGTPGARR
jgi:hypothetical protein